MIELTEKLALTRAEYKKRKQSGEPEQAESLQTRAIPIWLRFVIFIILMFVVATAGALVGYSGLGHGRAADVFTGKAFAHIYDLIAKK
jgi:hypothetical protein